MSSKKDLREIVLDTETTGLDVNSNHRIIEIGCVELINKIPTGIEFHEYINPERDVPEHASRIHGLTSEFLLSKKKFSEVAKTFIEFIKDDMLIIHNAEFDKRFLNMELNTKLNFPCISSERIIDTLSIARRKFSGSSVSLDALCKRFNINLINRKVHGALVDAQLLAKVYIELTGGVQISLNLDSRTKTDYTINNNIGYERKHLEPRKFSPTSDEINAHQELLKKIKNPLWYRVTK